jgi:outer membrane protein TolC
LEISKKVFSTKDQTLSRRRLALMMYQSQLVQAQENLKAVQERNKAGAATAAEVADAELNISIIQREIDQLKARMAQEKTP